MGQANVEQVTTLLERHGAVDMQEQEANWRQEGWTGYAAEPASETDQPSSGSGRVRSYEARSPLTPDDPALFGTRTHGDR